MEEFIDGNEYLIDLSRIDTIPEIIFELSSVLDRDDAKNKKISLKLGSVKLNQAQILSIKSLISGIGSSLSSIKSSSEETEKTAYSLGLADIKENAGSSQAEDDIYAIVEENDAAARQEPQEKFVSETSKTENRFLDAGMPVQEDFLKAEETPLENKTDLLIEENIDLGIDEKIKTALEKEAGNLTGAADAGAEDNSDDNITADAAMGMQSEPPEKIYNELDIIFGSSAAAAEVFDNHAETEENSSVSYIDVPEQEYTKEDIEIDMFPVKYIKQTVRSGQVISFDGNIIVIGDCHPGSEITASGDITVWGVLSGIAHAGANGNKKARIRALKMNAVQLRIADCYARRPDALNTIFAEKTNSFTPEEARIINGGIVLFKIND